MDLLLLWKEGHLNWDHPQASKPPLAPCLVFNEPHWKRDCPQRHRFQGSDSQDNQGWRCLGFSTQAPVLIIPDKSWALITVCLGGGVQGWQSVNFLLDTGVTYSVLTEASGPLPSPSTSVMGLSGWAKSCCSLSCNRLCAIFKWVSNHTRVSLTPFGKGYTEQGLCLCFHEYGTLPFFPFYWTKCKS